MSEKSNETQSPAQLEHGTTKKIKKFILPDSPVEFLRDVLRAYPENDFQTVKKVISLGKIIYADNNLIPGQQMTACVMNTKPFTLAFGKEFLETNMESIEDAVYIVSHELTHLVLDHFAKDIIKEFEDKKLAYKAMHVIVDCQVNATVSNSLEEKYLSFIKRYYPKDKMPYCFFRPDGEPPQEYEALHDKLYSSQGISNKELIEGLMPWFKENQDQLNDIIKQLLGNHKELLEGRGSGNSSSEELDYLVDGVSQELKEALKKKMQEEQKEKQESQGKSSEGKDKEQKEASTEEPGGTQAGNGDRLVDIQIAISNIQDAKNIKNRLKNKDVISPSARIFKAIKNFFPKKSRRTVIPNFHDPRTAALYALGKWQVFHQTEEVGSKVLVACYLDVSGSQDHVLKDTIPAVIRLKREIGNIVHCFSTVVSEEPIQNLKTGKYHSTGGTCFNCVADHIIKNNYKSALILTDGEAGMSDKNIELLKKKGVKITVGWTTSHPSKEPLNQICKDSFFVFNSNNE